MSTIAQMTDIFYKVQLSCMITGLFGNLISFVVYSRKTFRRNSINVYCRALAIFDSYIMIVQMANTISIIFYNADLYAQSDSACKFSIYSFVATPPITSWILVLLAIDKLLCVMFPNRLFSFYSIFVIIL